MPNRTSLFLILLPALMLCALSLTMLGSIASTKVLPQSLFLILAFLIGWGTYRIGAKNLLSFSMVFYLSLVALLGLTVLTGRVSRGSARWLEVAGVRGQMSELAKPMLLLAGVAFLENLWGRSFTLQAKRFLQYGLLMLVPVLLVMLEPDLGTAIVLVIIAATLAFCSGIPKWILCVVIAGVLASVPLGHHVLADYQERRITSFLNPYSDPRGAGYHVIQSTIAVGSGEIFGRGLGRGTQSQLKFLPERQTDFIFASLVEELGLLGGDVVICLYVSMLLGLMLGVFSAREQGEFLILAGCAGWLFFQASINIAMNVGLAPVTGITLPFLSAGGSSLVTSSMMLGLALSSLNFTRQ